MSRDDMSYEDAVDYMGFNVTGAWVGEGTPVFVHLGPIENIEDAEGYMEENY
jgi:L,D-peptidoglycan transpeptidase YkuD (ErfK/YbiS/YcfS/YnhG family)